MLPTIIEDKNLRVYGNYVVTVGMLESNIFTTFTLIYDKTIKKI